MLILLDTNNSLSQYNKNMIIKKNNKYQLKKLRSKMGGEVQLLWLQPSKPFLQRNHWEKVMDLLQNKPNLTCFLATPYLHCNFLFPSLTMHTCIFIYLYITPKVEITRLAKQIHGYCS